MSKEALTLQECRDHGATIELFKDRTINLWREVSVTRRKDGSLSIRQNGVVVAHATRLAMQDVEFKENGRIDGFITSSGMGVNPAEVVKDKLPKIDYRAGVYNSSNGRPLKGASFIILYENDGIKGAYMHP